MGGEGVHQLQRVPGEQANAEAKVSDLCRSGSWETILVLLLFVKKVGKREHWPCSRPSHCIPPSGPSLARAFTSGCPQVRSKRATDGCSMAKTGRQRCRTNTGSAQCLR